MGWRVVTCDPTMTGSAADNVLDVVANEDISVKFAMRSPHARKWAARYTTGKLHEPVLTAHVLELLSPGQTFVDVGAHLGWFSLLAAARGARVVAFEMQTGLIPLIHESVGLNGFEDRVLVIPAGLGSACGIVPYGRRSLSASKGVLTATPEEALYAPCLTMDAALEGIEPDLVKIDVQGFEGHVIDGGRGTLAGSAPAIIMEMHNSSTQYGHSIASVLTTLHKWTMPSSCTTRIDGLPRLAPHSHPSSFTP
jgi:FkbM family methyltransferase